MSEVRRLAKLENVVLSNREVVVLKDLVAENEGDETAAIMLLCSWIEEARHDV
jgi:hypothetical protein